MSVFSGSGNMLHRQGLFGDNKEGPDEWHDLATVGVRSRIQENIVHP